MEPSQKQTGFFSNNELGLERVSSDPLEGFFDVPNAEVPQPARRQTRIKQDPLMGFFDKPKAEPRRKGAPYVADFEALIRAEGAEAYAPVIRAIYKQESGGGTNARTSIDGARGGMQVMPATFRQYARQGESIDNPEHNVRVGIRIIKGLGDRFGNDAAKIATGYFSGPGNVNPGAGAAWKHDHADGNGKRVSSYAADVVARVGRDGGPVPAAAHPAPRVASQVPTPSQPSPQNRLPDLTNVPPWAKLEASDEFAKFSPEEQMQAKIAYFDYYIAPHAGAEAASLREQFLAKGASAPKADAAPLKRTWGEAASDTGKQLVEGTLHLLGTPAKLAAPHGAAAHFFDSAAQSWRDKQSDFIKQKQAEADEKIRKAGEEGQRLGGAMGNIANQFGEVIETSLNDPALGARTIATNLPGMLATAGFGKLAQLGLMQKGMSAAQAAQIATTATGAINAISNAGDARGDAFEDIKSTLVQQGVAPAVAEEIALRQSLPSAAIGGLAGYLGGKTGLESAVMARDAARQGAGSLARQALKAGAQSAASEMLGELPEEVLPQVATNLMAAQHDGRSIAQDVGRTMAETMIGVGPGAVLAGGAGARHEYAAQRAARMQAAPESAPVAQKPAAVPAPEVAPAAAAPVLERADAAPTVVPTPQKPQPHPTVQAADAVVRELALENGVPLETVLPQSALDPVKEARAAELSMRAMDGEMAASEQAELAALQQEMAAQPEMPQPTGENEHGTETAQAQPTAAQGTEWQQTPQDEQLAPPRTEREAMARRRQTNLITPDGQKVAAQWDVVEADSVQASLKEGVSQPRDRSRAVSDAQVRGIAANPDFERLSDTSKTMDYGAPTLSPDGLIVGGNGRFEGISQAYDGRTAAAYRAELEQSAWRFGIDGNEVRAMQKPVLVRRVTADADTRQLAIQSNQPAGLQMSDMEQAALDAERMQGLERIAVSDTGDIPLTASNRQAIQHALGGYSTNEVAGMVGADGSLSQSGLRRVRNAILYRAYGKSETLARLIESPDADMKNVGTALVRAAGALAQMQDGVADGSIPAEFDIAADLTVAIETLSALRAESMNLGEFLAQADMFGGELTTAQTTIIRMLADNLRSAKNITAFLHDYAQQVMSLQDSANGLLGQMPVPSKEEVLDRARQQHTAPQRASAAPQLHARAAGGDREVQAGEGHRPDGHRQSGDEDAREARAGTGAGESRAEGKQEGEQEGVESTPRFNRSATAGEEQQGWLDGEPYKPLRQRLSDQEVRLVLDTFNTHTEGEKAGHVWQVEASHDIGAKSRAFQALAQANGWHIAPGAEGDKYFLVGNKPFEGRHWGDTVTVPVRVSDHSNVNRGYHAKESAINLAPDDGYAFDTFESALWKLNNATEDDAGQLMFGEEEAIYFQRSETTQQAYEQRIDALFAGAKPNRIGVRILDRSDVLGLLGHADKPVLIAESKVVQGQVNHPRITAEVWKKIPQWLDAPAAVFESDTDGGLVFLAPETIYGSPVSLIVLPDKDGRNSLGVHLLLNAYDRSRSTPFGRWVRDGLLKYVDQKKFPALFESVAGRRLPGTALQNKPGTGKILTEKNLAGLRKENAPQFNRTEDAAEQQFAETARAYGGHEAYEQAKAEGRTHLNYRQWVQVRTPAFKAWFGDWENDPENASKVVNAETGEPLVVYHGTSKRDAILNGGFKKGWAHLTDSRSVADSYQAWIKNGDVTPGTLDLYVKANNPAYYEAKGQKYTEIGHKVFRATSDAERGGHDAIIITKIRDNFDSSVPTSPHTTVVAFNPAQIKSATDNSGAFDAGNNDIRYSRSETTKAAYEQRIDELFAGGKANRVGARVLDRSDVLGLLGHADKPVVLQESKVIAGQENHPRMTAEHWKKIPEWLDNPVAVFKSDTESGRLVVIAPETIGSSPVSIIMEPEPMASGGTRMSAHLLVNAYDRSGNTPFVRWINDGLLQYVDKKKFPAFFAQSVGRQLPNTALQNKQGMPKILTEKNLAGRRKDQSLLSNRRSDTTEAPHDNRIIRDDSPDTQRAVGLLNRFFEGRGGDPVSFQGVRTEGIDSVVPLAQALGAKVVGVKVREGLTPKQLSAIERFNGARYQGYIYLDADTRRPHLAVLGHEMAHEMRAKRPDLYDRMIEAIRPYVKQKEYGHWVLNDVVARKEESHDKKHEEFIGEVLSDGFMEPEFWRALGKKNKQLLVQVQNFLARILQKIAATVGYTRKTEAYLTDYERVMQIAGEVMGEYGLDQGKFHRMAGIDVRFNRAAGQTENSQGDATEPAQPRWEAPEPSKLEKIIHDFQDKHINLKRVQEEIGKIRQIGEQFDAYQKEELYHGRVAARVEKFGQNELRVLLQDMRLKGVDMPTLEAFLWARHAKERNAQIARVNPEMPDGGSGLTDAQVDQYLAGLDVKGEDGEVIVPGLKAGQRHMLEKLAARVNDIIRGTEEVLIQYGLETRETIDKWRETYAHYVPLHREDMDGGTPIGMGFSVKGSASKRATGSSRKVVDILAHVALQREAAITRGEKNRVGLALYGLALENPQAAFWAVDKVPQIKTVDKKTGQVVVRPDTNYKSRANVFAVRLGGQDRAIVFNEGNQRAMQMVESLKNLDAEQLGWLTRSAGTVTRYFSAINTQYNPIFGIKNGLRDVQSAALNISSTELRGHAFAVLSDVPAAMKAIWQIERGGQSNTAYDQLYEDMKMSGGTTGYREILRMGADRAKAIQAQLDSVDSGVALRGVKAALEVLDHYNTAIENGTRLAAYKKAIDLGYSKDKAASIAKNITVNFNRKGSKTSGIGAWWAFFNAAVQGTARTVQTLSGPAGKKILVGGFTLGMLQALMASIGFEDDEWEDIPEFEKQRSLIIPVGGGDFIKVPMAMGFNILPNLGRIATEQMLGRRKVQDSLVDVLAVLLESANPFGSATALQTMSPTPTDPVVALLENKTFSGRAIAKEDANPLQPTPGFTRARDTSSHLSRGLAWGLNRASGGTDYTPGMVSPTPDQLDYLFGSITGGVGREVNRAYQFSELLLRGEEVPQNKKPLFSSFYGATQDDMTVSGRYWRNVKELNAIEQEVKGRVRDGLDATDFVDEHPQIYVARAANKVERQITKMRQERSRVEFDAKMPEAERTTRLKDLDSNIVQAMKDYNDMVAKARKRKLE